MVDTDLSFRYERVVWFGRGEDKPIKEAGNITACYDVQPGWKVMRTEGVVAFGASIRQHLVSVNQKGAAPAACDGKRNHHGLQLERVHTIVETRPEARIRCFAGSVCGAPSKDHFKDTVVRSPEIWTAMLERVAEGESKIVANAPDPDASPSAR